MTGERTSRGGTYMISAVAELYDIHPQTLRLYEREGLLRPDRSEGNTRLYSSDDLERLEFILTLTRELGVNLAGVEVILNMRRNMSRLQQDVASLMTYMRDELLKNDRDLKSRFEQALVRVERGPLVVQARKTRITVRTVSRATSAGGGSSKESSAS